MAYGQTLQRNGPHEFSKATIGVTRERGTSLSNTAKCVSSKGISHVSEQHAPPPDTFRWLLFVEEKHNFYSHSAICDLAHSDRHPPSTAVYTFDGGHTQSIPRCMPVSSNIWTDLCAKQIVALHEQVVRCARVVFDSKGTEHFRNVAG